MNWENWWKLETRFIRKGNLERDNLNRDETSLSLHCFTCCTIYTDHFRCNADFWTVSATGL